VHAQKRSDMSNTVTPTTTTTPIPTERTLEVIECHPDLKDRVGMMIKFELPKIRDAFESPNKPYIRFSDADDGTKCWEIKAPQFIFDAVEILIREAELRTIGIEVSVPETDVNLTKVVLARLSQLHRPNARVRFDNVNRLWIFRAPTQSALDSLQHDWKELVDSCKSYLDRKNRPRPEIRKYNYDPQQATRLSAPAPVWSDDDFPELRGVA
jgi:hypothetical protein